MRTIDIATMWPPTCDVSRIQTPYFGWSNVNLKYEGVYTHSITDLAHFGLHEMEKKIIEKMLSRLKQPDEAQSNCRHFWSLDQCQHTFVGLASATPAGWKCKWTRWSVFASAWHDTTRSTNPPFNDMRDFYIESEAADSWSWFVCFTNFSNHREYIFIITIRCGGGAKPVPLARYTRATFVSLVDNIYACTQPAAISQANDLNLCIFHHINVNSANRHFNRDFR